MKHLFAGQVLLLLPNEQCQSTPFSKIEVLLTVLKLTLTASIFIKIFTLCETVYFLMSKAHSDVVLQDESHFLKNSKSVRAKKGLQLLKVFWSFYRCLPTTVLVCVELLIVLLLCIVCEFLCSLCTVTVFSSSGPNLAYSLRITSKQSWGICRGSTVDISSVQATTWADADDTTKHGGWQVLNY